MKKIGAELSGIPAGERIDYAALQAFMRRRAPGYSEYTTARREPDIPVITSGITNGATDGETIRIVIENRDAVSADYKELLDCPRPGHADYTAWVKYGGKGGHARRRSFLRTHDGSALRRGWRVPADSEKRNINISAHILLIGDISDTPYDPMRGVAEVCGEFPCVSPEAAEHMKRSILLRRRRATRWEPS